MNAPWMPIAQSYTGLREIKGRKSDPVIAKWLEDIGLTGSDETPWCSAMVNGVMTEAGYVGTGSGLARSWLKWGKRLRKPKFGCVVVFQRGSSSWQGHVAFFVKENSTHIWVLGGNQRNAVNVSKYSKKKILGYRWPSGLGNSRTVKATVTSASTGAGAQVVSTITDVQSTMAGIPLNFIQYGLVATSVLALCAVIYFRWEDITNKGR